MVAIKRLITLCRLSRVGNLIFIAATQLIIYYFYLLPYIQFHDFLSSQVNVWQVLLFIATTVIVAASGNVLNDLIDQESDRINKPNKLIIGKYISEKKVIYLFFILASLGMLSSSILCLMENKWQWVWIYPVSVLILVLYNKVLKCIPLIGNIVISIFCAGVFAIVGLLEWSNLSHLKSSLANDSNYSHAFWIVIIFCWLSFWLTWAREMIKDVEDIHGDKEVGCNTFATIVPEKISRTLVIVLMAIPLISLIGWMTFHSSWSQVITTLLWLAIPLSYLLSQVISLTHIGEYSRLSKLIKYYMFLALLFLIAFPFMHYYLAF